MTQKLGVCGGRLGRESRRQHQPGPFFINGAFTAALIRGAFALASNGVFVVASADCIGLVLGHYDARANDSGLSSIQQATTWR